MTRSRLSFYLIVLAIGAAMAGNLAGYGDIVAAAVFVAAVCGALVWALKPLPAWLQEADPLAPEKVLPWLKSRLKRG
jgi:hypothetical protein